jgi:hypothetical protein
MAISAGLGLGGSRPGVCTSTTRPTAPYEGMMIYETDTNRVLVWDNAAWVMIADTDTPPGLQLIKAGTASVTTSAPLDLLSVFTSEFRNYLLILHAEQTVANTNVEMRLISGTNTIETGAYYNNKLGGYYVASGPVYYWAGYSATNPFSPSTVWFTGMAIGSGGYSANARIDIMNPNIADQETRYFVQSYADWTGTYYDVSLSGGGHLATGTQYTGLRIMTSGGTTALTYKLYGYRD